MIVHPIRAWGAVELLFLVATGETVVGDGAILAFRFGDDLWDARGVFGNWKHRANERYWRGQQSINPSLAHPEAVRRWIDQTRSLAADLQVVYGDEAAAAARAAADQVEQTTGWLETQLAAPPTTATQRAQSLLTIELWAFDVVTRELRRSAAPDGIPGRDAGRTAWLAASIEALAEAGLEHARSDEALKMRVRRLRVKPGQEDALVADVLAACRVGPYDRRGNPQPAA